MATIEATLPTLTNGHNGHVEEIEAVELTGAQIVCKALEAEGVEIVFGYPGGAVIPAVRCAAAGRLPSCADPLRAMGGAGCRRICPRDR